MGSFFEKIFFGFYVYCSATVIGCELSMEMKNENGSVIYCEPKISTCKNGSFCQYSTDRQASVCCNMQISKENFIVDSTFKNQIRRKRRQQEVYLDPIYQKPISCDMFETQRKTCPTDYHCVMVYHLDGAFCGKNVVTGNGVRLVCPNFEYPFFGQGSLLPLPCDTNDACPMNFVCKYSEFYLKTICCRPYIG